MKFIFNDGGRAAAGFKGGAGDCVTRAIAIATGKPYREIYDDINEIAKTERPRNRKRSAARLGVNKRTIRKYLTGLGWQWTPTMRIGSGCTVHLADGELPGGRLVVSVSKHLTAVIGGEIHDTFDPQRTAHVMNFNGASSSDDPRVTHTIQRRCVYGYFSAPKPQTSKREVTK